MANDRRPLPNPSRVRVVLDSGDANRDKFIARRLADELIARGELVEIDIGPAYGRAYAPARSAR